MSTGEDLEADENEAHKAARASDRVVKFAEGEGVALNKAADRCMLQNLRQCRGLSRARYRYR
jgi:hypothetical protein